MYVPAHGMPSMLAVENPSCRHRSKAATRLQAAERDHPDVIVSNITMPGVNGFEAARRIRKRSPDLPIIFISADTQHIYVEEAIKIGVAGYIFKGRVQSELLPAIDCALRGETFFSKPKGGNFISR